MTPQDSSRPLLRPWLLAALAIMALLTPGCGGCQPETPQERAAREQREAEEAEKKKKEQEEKGKKPPLEVKPPAPQPNQTDLAVGLVKPGHWMAATQPMKANRQAWVGESTLQIVDKQSQPIPVDRTAFSLRSSQDVAVPKDQDKRVETVFFVPAAEGQLRARNGLRQRGAGMLGAPIGNPMRRMAAHQHHLVVLAKDPQQYGFLKSTSVVTERFSTDFDLSYSNAHLPMEVQYQVVLAPTSERAPLPDNPLCWTTIAYLLWDEVAPEQLEPAQRDALIDWLHWGGQLVISGPDSLDLLPESFLEPYLPADSAGARTITADNLRPLSRAWGVSRRRTPLEPVSEWSGVKLKLRPAAEPLPAVKDLFAERRVGRGRVIVSAMQLSEAELIDWAGGFDNLLNSLLLRREPREFRVAKVFDDRQDPVYVWRNRAYQSYLDASKNSKLHYFTRDTYDDPNATAYQVAESQNAAFDNFGGDQDEYATRILKRPSAAGGPASWNDFSAVAEAARGSLREAAGVNVPGSGFVILCLAAYLTVLAPINWLVFKALGRVEWAWVAAPIIALLGTWVVVRQAQLDIGFVRAQTEVAILETQPDHSRGCLTRYLSFYTSLSTTYDLEFDDPTSLAAPFARSDQSPLRSGDTPRLVTYQKQQRARLKGLTVSSNSTDLAHTDQMFDLGGSIHLDPQRNKLTNETEYDLVSLAVVRRPKGPGEATLEGCWIGDLDGRSSTTVSFLPLVGVKNLFADKRATEAEQAIGERLNVEPLFEMALDPERFEPGEVRAVALIDDVLPGVSVSPQASQKRGATLLVAHLKYGPLPPPRNDKNSAIDLRRSNR